MIIQQIVQLAAIDFIHRHCDCEVTAFILPIVNTTIKQIWNSKLLQALHCVSFSTACLSIGENGDRPCIEHQVKYRLYWTVVELVIGLRLTEGIIVFELMVFDVFSDSVNFELVLVNYDFRITERYGVNLSGLKFFLK